MCKKIATIILLIIVFVILLLLSIKFSSPLLLLISMTSLAYSFYFAYRLINEDIEDLDDDVDWM